MIPVAMAPEPAAFDKQIRKPGLLAIAEMVGEKPGRSKGRPFSKVCDRREEIPSVKFPPYWTNCLDDLMRAYREVCSYSCFRIHPVTGARSADHCLPKSRRWDLAYEWSNYRLACSLMNSRKGILEDVLDPFEIESETFVLELVFFTVRPNPILPRKIQRQADSTIETLRLNESVLTRRRGHDAEQYWSGEVSLKVLLQESPFVAHELRRQGRLRPDDI
ncbi:MAG: hypothetical protein R3C59_12585 [Planctomycetaceae bacterium]